MRIVMIKEAAGSPDGVNIKTFPAGEEYEIGSPLMSQVLAECFLDSGNAQEVQPDGKNTATKGKPKSDSTSGVASGG